MAYRLTVSDRAVREIGEAYEWYEEQVPGLGGLMAASHYNCQARMDRDPSELTFVSP